MFVVFGLMLTTCFAIVLRVYEDEVSSLFTKDPETIGYIKEVLPLLSVYIIFDTIHGV